jgi:HSP20 family molecular chaperone IbpA
MLFLTDHHAPWFLHNGPGHTNPRRYDSIPGSRPHQGCWFHPFHHTQPSIARLFAGLFVRNLAMFVMTWLSVSAALGIFSFLLSLLMSPPFWVAFLVLVLSVPCHVAFSAPHRPNRCGRPSANCRGNLLRHRHNAQQHHPFHVYIKGLHNAAAAAALRQAQETETSAPPPNSKAAGQEALENHPQPKSTTIIPNHIASFRLETENDDSITLSIDVPRFPWDGLELEISPTGILSVSGKRGTKTGDTVLFTKKIALDQTKVDVKDTSAIKADLSLGVLEITIPKVKNVDAAQLQFRVIPITTNASTPEGQENKQNGKNAKNEKDQEMAMIGNVETVQEIEEDNDDEVLIRA